MFATLRRSIRLALGTVALSALTAARPAHAQSAFDQNAARMVNGLMAQNNARMEQVWQYHLQVNGPRLRAQYRQFCASGQNPGMSFEQFAYNDMMSAGGTNWAAARQAQRDQFIGLGIAHQTQVAGGESLIAGMEDNSRRGIAATERWTNGSIRGLAPYIDPNSGATRLLPLSLAAGQIYNDGRTIYTRDAAGTFYQRTGHGWQAMPVGR